MGLGLMLCLELYHPRLDDIESEGTCGCLNLTYLHHDLGIADIAQECQSAETGDHLAQ